MQRRLTKRILCMTAVIVLLLTSAPFVTFAEEIITAVTTPYTFSYEDSNISVDAHISRDTVFTSNGTALKNSEVQLEGDTSDDGRFAELSRDFDGEILTVGLSFTSGGEEVEQEKGSTELTLTFPESEDRSVGNAEVFRYTETENGEDGFIERVAVSGSEDNSITFYAGELTSYAVRYTVDYFYEDQQFSMTGGEYMLLSELFEQLLIKRDSADVESITFTDDSLIRFTRTDNECDWIIQSLKPFDTEETMTLFFSDGYSFKIKVTDDQTYSESTDLSLFTTSWKIQIGNTLYTDDMVDENTVLEYKKGVRYTLELLFAETPSLGFATPDPGNVPEMTYMLPDAFVIPDDFRETININLGRQGSLPGNILYVSKSIGADGSEHRYLNLRWNWEDTAHWTAFQASASAKLKFVINGVFDDEGPGVLSINGKDISIRKEDLHNAIISKEGNYDITTNTVTYTVSVKSDGTVQDITLTDTMGSALIYNGDIVFDAANSVNTANTVPQITAKTGNTFNVVMALLHFRDGCDRRIERQRPFRQLRRHIPRQEQLHAAVNDVFRRKHHEHKVLKAADDLQNG